jgi:hypothetical protein
LIHARATIGGTGAPTVVADTDATTGEAGTTPGCSINRISAGIYELTFPPCRMVQLGTFVGNLLPADATFATQGDLRGPALVDRTDANTSAKLGKIRFAFPTNVGGVPGTEIATGAEMNVSVWADFG